MPKKIRSKQDRQHGILHTVDDKTLRKGGLRTASTLYQTLCLQGNFPALVDKILQEVGTRATSTLEKADSWRK